jgi:hypothetical protein
VAPARKPFTAGKAVLAVVAIAAAVAVGLLRQLGPGALNTIWAEDGSIFYAEAVQKGPWAALTTSYAGYFHAVPRLLAAIASIFPPSAAATVLAAGAALIVALLALLVYVASAAHLTSTVARIVVSALVVVVPVAQDEVLNSVANFHWYGLYVLFWVFLWSPRSRAGQVVAVAAVLLVATSDILVLAYVPLALFRFFHKEEGRLGKILGGALALGLVVQFIGLATGSSERELDPNPVRAAVGYLLRAVPAPLIGQRWLGHQIGARWVALAAVAWLLVAVAFVVALRGLTRPAWVLAGAAVIQSAALYVLPVVLSGVAAPRYAVAPALLVVVALVAILRPKQGNAVPLSVLAGFLAVIALVNLRIDNPRAHGPAWDAELDKARATCAPGATAAIPIAPVETPPWLVQVTCEKLN